MNPDDFKQAWQDQASQTRLAIDTDRLVEQVRDDQQKFAAMIFWRDVREVGTAVVLLPIWIGLGVGLALPWTWYLTLPVLVWIAGYMLVDLLRHRRQPDDPAEPLRQRVETSLTQVDRQIWLLRRVLWWYLLPMFVSIMIFVGHIAWLSRAGVWGAALLIAILGGVVSFVHVSIYRLNQTAVQTVLEPKRQELVTLLASLTDEAAPP